MEENKYLEGVFYFFDSEGKKRYDEDGIIAKLLQEGVLFTNTRNYVDIDDTDAGETVVVFVNCNDIWVWGCADASRLEWNQIVPLFEMWAADKTWGPTKWACHFRQMQPQEPIVEDMKKDGSWDEAMEKLPKNEYDGLDFNETTIKLNESLEGA